MVKEKLFVLKNQYEAECPDIKFPKLFRFSRFCDWERFPDVIFFVFISLFSNFFP